MAPSFLKTRRRRTSLRLFCAGFLVVFSLLLSACGSTSTGGGSTPTVTVAGSTPTPSPTATPLGLGCTSSTGSGATPTPIASVPALAAPTDLIASGTLKVGSDTTYPPQEFIDTASGKPTGFDVDLINAMAQKLGLQGNVVTANFSTIIDDLGAKRYDVVISAVSINADRLKKADFVPYFQSGESLIVPTGNPKGLQCVGNLCGLKVGVQSGTVELDDLNAGNTACTKGGKAAIQLTVLANQTDVINLLATGRVDATYQDSPVSDYYLKLNPGMFQIGGTVVNTSPEGIVVRKGDTSMLNAMEAAFAAVKADGTYDMLFTKWQLSNSQKI